MAGIKPVFVLLSIKKLSYFSLPGRFPVWIGAILILPLLFSFFGCKHKTKSPSLEQDSKHLATLFCEAKLLRLERFQLADQIRFTEDSLLQFPEKQMYFRTLLDSMNDLIEPLHQKTKEKAEEIKLLQKKLYDSIYTSKEDRIFLDQEFLKISKEMCPDK